MSDCAQVKKDLRAKMRALRDGLDSRQRAQVDSQIAAHVSRLPEYQSAQVVFTYLSVGTEVDTREIIGQAWRHGKTVAVPRCVAGTNLMEWYRIENFEGLEPGAFGIEEPAPMPALRVHPPNCRTASGRKLDSLALVPAFSFDEAGFRLGYGGGFYDVFLSDFGGRSIGLCRSVQLSGDPLPRYNTDMPVDIVVTEVGVRRVPSLDRG